MRLLSLIVVVSLVLTTQAWATNLSQDTERLQSEGPAIRQKLQANDWKLIGQVFARRSIDQSHFVAESISVYYDEEKNEDFAASLHLPPTAQVYYEFTENLTLRIERFDSPEVVVLPWHMSFAEDGTLYVNNRQKDFVFQYWLHFDPERPGVVGLHLQTVNNKPGVSRIFGDLQFVDGQMRLVQNIGSQQIRWDFAVDQ